jgi:hypothetical protein
MSAKSNTGTLHALGELRAALTEKSIDLLRSQDFRRAQALTQVNQELKEIEAKLIEILGEQSSIGQDPLDSERYPRYVRESPKVLVKIGPRSGGEGEYKQALLKSEFDDLIDRLRDMRGRAHEFEAGDLIPQVQFPQYKVYVVLGLLQKFGLLDSPRRGRYRYRGDVENWGGDVWDRVERAPVQFSQRAPLSSTRGSR